MTMVDIERLNSEIQKYLSIYPDGRLFICKGIPQLHSPMLIGYNPATSMNYPWTDFWSNKTGYLYDEWLVLYKKERAQLFNCNNQKKEVSNTRLRIQKFREFITDDVIETNIWTTPSKSVKNLEEK